MSSKLLQAVIGESLCKDFDAETDEAVVYEKGHPRTKPRRQHRGLGCLNCQESVRTVRKFA